MNSMTTPNFTHLSSDGWPRMGGSELALTDKESARLLRTTDHMLWWAKNKHTTRKAA